MEELFSVNRQYSGLVDGMAMVYLGGGFDGSYPPVVPQTEWQACTTITPNLDHSRAARRESDMLGLMELYVHL